MQWIITCLGINLNYSFFFNRTKAKCTMNAESVVSVIFCSDSESDWNRSDEEGEDCFGDDSLCVDRLSMELGKTADKRGVLT